MKIIIAGGRDFTDKEGLLQTFHQITNHTPNKDITVISGCAKGADSVGQWIANEYRLLIERYPADWDTYGKSAGYARNELMATKATHLLAAWDGQSKGTKHMIDIGRKYNLIITVHLY